jgi:hypothetical protein
MQKTHKKLTATDFKKPVVLPVNINELEYYDN